jgi:uncharacterized protein YndB with AHSA1/START domain
MPARSDAFVTDSPERALIIERIFDAPPELVFKCWTEPQHLARWIGPAQDLNATILACELRVGGSYRVHMLGLDGQDHWQQGIFREIVPPERIVRTYCWTDAQGRPMLPETLLTATFDDLGGRTKLTLHQAVFESTNARDLHQGGWSSALDKLADYIAKGT